MVIKYSTITSINHAKRVIQKVVANKHDTGVSISVLHRWTSQSYGPDFPSYHIFWRWLNNMNAGIELRHAMAAIELLDKRKIIIKR